MKPWKRFQEWIADHLDWEYIKKKHYGDSVPDVKGEGYTGECKHHKKFAIHTLSNKTNLLYKDDVIIFTKVKGTHYVPRNILVTLNLEQFDVLLQCQRIAGKVDIANKDVNFNGDKLTLDLKYIRSIVKTVLQKINKIIKQKEK